jgi:hypothetical protein
MPGGPIDGQLLSDILKGLRMQAVPDEADLPHRHDAFGVMPVRRRDVDRQRRRGRDWLSMTTALGSGESPKVRRQVGLPVKHPAPRAERVQRANCP